MTIVPGSVVTLKSGGQAMTVVAVDEDEADCLWCGEEGEFFREKIPTIALQAAEFDDENEEEGDDEAGDDDDAEGDDDAEDKERTAA